MRKGNMKKIIKIMLCLSLVLSMTACNKDRAHIEEPPPEDISEPFELGEDVLIAEIKLDTEYQTIIGFGASYTWYSDLALRVPSQKEELADLLFADAKMTILRFKNDYETSLSTVEANAKEIQFYNLARERAAEYGEDVIVLLSSWSPPARLKSNDSVNGRDSQNGDGTLGKNQDGEYMYEEFAKWWADSVEAYRNAGLAIDYISIQNECDFPATYDGMLLAMTETETRAEYAKAFLATYHEMQSRFGSQAPLLLGPETMTFNRMDLQMYMKNVINTLPEAIAGIAFHLYVGGNSTGESGDGLGPGKSRNQPDSFINNFLENRLEFGDDYPLWQTEFYRGMPMDTALLMNNALTYGNVSAYLHWTGIWERGFPSHDLIGINRRGEYFVGASFYVMRHFSEFIRPGYIRVEIDFPPASEISASAFKSPCGTKLAVVLINPTDEDSEVALPLENYKITDSAVYQTALEKDSYESEEYYINIGALGQGNTVLLKAYSITTIDITGEI